MIIKPKFAFTLVELLIVIAIMAVVSVMSVGLLRSASDDAKTAATNSRIAKIEALLQMELENYEVRRLPIRLGELRNYVSNNRQTGVNFMVQLRDLKRRIQQDILGSEMPGAFISGGVLVTNPDLGRFPTEEEIIQPWSGGGQVAAYKIGFRDWLDNYYPNPVSGTTLADRLAQVRSSGTQKWLSKSSDADFKEPGEYLYAILENIDAGGVSAVESLGDSAIDNLDGDSHPSVVDAWGNDLQLRILQVIAEEQNGSGSFMPDTGLWIDYPVDWNTKQNSGVPTDGLPVGYCPLNPVVPRPLHKIKFQVVSPRLDSY